MRFFYHCLFNKNKYYSTNHDDSNDSSTVITTSETRDKARIKYSNDNKLFNIIVNHVEINYMKNNKNNNNTNTNVTNSINTTDKFSNSYEKNSIKLFINKYEYLDEIIEGTTITNNIFDDNDDNHIKQVYTLLMLKDDQITFFDNIIQYNIRRFKEYINNSYDNNNDDDNNNTDTTNITINITINTIIYYYENNRILYDGIKYNKDKHDNDNDNDYDNYKNQYEQLFSPIYKFTGNYYDDKETYTFKIIKNQYSKIFYVPIIVNETITTITTFNNGDNKDNNNDDHHHNDINTSTTTTTTTRTSIHNNFILFYLKLQKFTKKCFLEEIHKLENITYTNTIENTTNISIITLYKLECNHFKDYLLL
jgi:hypothetical protein